MNYNSIPDTITYVFWQSGGEILNQDLLSKNSLKDFFFSFINKTIDIITTRDLYVFLFFLSVIIFFKWPIWTTKPFWDSTFGIFSAVDFLLENNFSFSEILKQPTFFSGGAGMNNFNLVTLLTAIIIRLTGLSGTYCWFLLHTIHFILAAFTAVVLFKMHLHVFEKTTSFLLSLLILVYPVFFTQVGLLYLEIIPILFSVLAILKFLENKIFFSSLFLLFAVLAKPTGIIAIATLCLMLLFSKEFSISAKVKKIVYLSLPSILFVLLIISMSSYRAQAEAIYNVRKYHTYLLLDFGDMISTIIDTNISQIYTRQLAYAPDLSFFILLSLLLSVVLFWKSFGKECVKWKVVQYNITFIFTYFAFYTFFWHLLSSSSIILFLLRYSVYLIPSVFFVIFYFIDTNISSKQFKVGFLLLAITLSLINQSGVLYTPFIGTLRSPSIAERSEEYLGSYYFLSDFFSLVDEALPHDKPIYTNLATYYHMKYPTADYVQKRYDRLIMIRSQLSELKTELSKKTADSFLDAPTNVDELDLPDSFYVVHINLGIFTQQVKGFLDELIASDLFAVYHLTPLSVVVQNHYGHVFLVKKETQEAK